MRCSPIREAVRAATHYCTRALQTLIHGKDCYIVIVIYRPNTFLVQVFRIQSQNNVWQSQSEGLRGYNPIATRQWRHCHVAMVLQPCITNRNNHRTMFLSLWPKACQAVFPLQPCNDVIAVLQWYCSPVSLKWTVNGVYYNMFIFYRIDMLGI